MMKRKGSDIAEYSIILTLIGLIGAVSFLSFDGSKMQRIFLDSFLGSKDYSKNTVGITVPVNGKINIKPVNSMLVETGASAGSYLH